MWQLGDSTPPEDMYFYYATVPISGSGGSSGNAPGYGGFDDGLGFSGASLATSLQALPLENAGAGMNSGDIEYGFWIVIPSSTAPADWTWNGDPIVFTVGGIVTQICYEAELAFVDITDWSLLSLGSTVGNTTLQGAVPLYTDAGWAAFWQTFAVQLFGTGITGGSSLVGNAITLTILNTYVPELSPIQTHSVSPVPSTQDDSFNEIACP